MKKWPWLIVLPFFQCCSAPGLHYTIANTHSHNDYEQPIPFWTAYNAQFGSIEADIFLIDGSRSRLRS
jgi:alkaline phosphatase